MIESIAVLLAFQLAGEALSRLLIPVAPGPVIGLALLLGAFALRPALAERMRATANGVLAHLSLFFVPAGVGVTTQLHRLGEDGAALAAALMISTLLAIAVGGAVFVLVARLFGGRG